MAKEAIPCSNLIEFMSRLLIDGYNLMGVMASLGPTRRKNLEQARGELLALLADYRQRAPSSHSITVVFDGQAGLGEFTGSHQYGIEVRFSRGEKADDLILRLLRGEKRGFILVTSDRALADAARGLARSVLRSREFASRVIARTKMDSEQGFPDRTEDEEDYRPSTPKKGNPKRLPKRERLRERLLRRL